MPVIYVCSRCGAVVKAVRTLADVKCLGLPSPTELAAQLTKCPGCGSMLSGGAPRRVEVVITR